MPWTHDKSLARILAHLKDLDERGITISKLSKKTEDLEALLSETNNREIFGAHVYVDATNFNEYSSASITQTNDYKKFLRSTQVYQAEVARIADKLFDAYFVHFQGAKLHALIYRPVDDGSAIAKRTVLLMLALRDWVDGVFNPFGKFAEPFVVAGGSDIGDVIGTRNGPRQGRELLFLGPAANNAAKIIATSSSRITKQIYDLLPADYQALCKGTATPGVFAVSCSQDKLDALLAAEKVTWNREALRKRLEDAEAAISLNDIQYSGATERIDFSTLSIKNNKRIVAATVFADVDGFTKYIASRTTESEKLVALRLFHAIRRESGRIARTDYEGTQVQFQGDRIQIIINVPNGDDAAIALTATEIAIALNTAMETTLREALGSDMTVHYAIGVDLGTTLATRFGPHGDRDNVCLGATVVNAATLQERLASSKQIVISKKVYDLLPDSHSTHFQKIEGWDAYTSTGLTLLEIEKGKEAKKYATAGLLAGGVIAAAAVIGAGVAAARSSQPPKSWLP